jgi:hypothetical protein
MPKLIDGPVSACFAPVPFTGNTRFEDLASSSAITPAMARAVAQAPRGDAVGWGIPFQVERPLLVNQEVVSIPVNPVQAGWLVFLHTSDGRQVEYANGQMTYPDPKEPIIGEGRLNEHAADYVILYADGSEARAQVLRRHQVGLYAHRWGETCFEAVGAHKHQPIRAHHEQSIQSWGVSQTRASANDLWDWTNWLWAWQNPHPEKTIVGLRFEPAPAAQTGWGSILISGISAGSASEQPLRWRTRRKATLKLPDGVKFDPTLSEDGVLSQIQLDMGQVISALPRTLYPEADWENSYNNQLPVISDNEILVEYTSHPQACFHTATGECIHVADVEAKIAGLPLTPITPATQRVTIKVIEKYSRRLVAAKLHVHGAAGEYLAPLDRHRIINPAWFEDYSADFMHAWQHSTTYIPGETVIDLPLGTVYLEISKGFEIRPVRKTIQVTGDMREVVVEIEKVLSWREHGWVTADTHVHFLSPTTAMLEGAGEGVNVVNLLASQWGELMTNVGDFDGRSTWGTGETGSGPEENGEYLVRVGTENRQHVLGHISLLGYRGRVIAPMTTGGPDESALGDPIEVLLTEWARQCKAQGGLVVLPHFPNPRAEHAASIISGEIDALEATSWGALYDGIDPYSLADWYRYLNCGYPVAIVGGTDKMSADTAVGTLRTYAHIPDGQPFTFENWMNAVRRAETFVTNGPLIDFNVDGHPAGARIRFARSGGTVDVTWQVSTVTVPVTSIDLVVNGEVRQSATLQSDGGAGSWSMRFDKSAWLALLVRGHYPDQRPIVCAHTSPVMIDVDGTQLLAAADAVTILEQVEGALAYLDTIGTRAEDQVYKRMRMVLVSAHRGLHNRLHQQGFYHEHSPVTDHPEHH